MTPLIPHPWRVLARMFYGLFLLVHATWLSAAPTYYVSPQGDDATSGLSPQTPWRTAGRVNSATFEAGTHILFQRGGEWRERLIASSSGTIDQPITYGAYGAGPKPKFWGSDVLDRSAFQPLSGSASTYTLNTAAPVNSILINQQFARWSRLISGSADPAANINYVKANPNTWYHDGANLYLNTGGVNPATDTRTYTAAVREDVVHSAEMNNLVFRDLVVDETAKFNSGYAFRVQYSSNVKIIDSEAYRAGKHHFAAISSTGFVGHNLHAQYAMPDQGSGGASAYVAYSDPSRSKDSSRWVNVTVEDPGGFYPAFVSHGEGIGDVQIVNLVARGGAGIFIGSESPDTRINIKGGSIENAPVDVYGGGVRIDGLRITGKAGNISLNGSGNVVQNVDIDGYAPFFYHNRNGAIIDSAGGNIVRYNRIRLDPEWLAPRGAIALLDGASGSLFEGNVFLDPDAFMIFNENSTFLSDKNVFVPGSRFTEILTTGGIRTVDLATWQSYGYDLHSRVGENIWTYYLEPRRLPGADPRNIPEPGALLLIALATPALALRRRRLCSYQTPL